VDVGVGAAPHTPLISTYALIDSGCSSVLLDNAILSNSTCINQLDVVTDDSLTLSGAFQEMSADIKAYFYGYLILYDTQGKPYPIYTKIFIANGLSWPMFIGCNVFKSVNFRAIIHDGLIMADPSNPSIEKHIPFNYVGPNAKRHCLRNSSTIILRADSDTMVQTDFNPNNASSNVLVFSDEYQSRPFHTFHGTYQHTRNKPFKILLQNFTHDDIYLQANSVVGHYVLDTDSCNQFATFSIDCHSSTIQASLLPDNLAANLLRFYPSQGTHSAEHTKRCQQIMQDMTDKGFSQYTTTDVYESQQDSHSFNLPTARKTSSNTPHEIFNLLPKDHLSSSQQALLFQFITRYHNIFAKDITQLGKTHLVELSADIRPGVDLSKFALKIKDTPLAYRQQLETILSQMVEAKLIAPADGIIRIITPIRLIPKKDPTKMRLINDVRITNAVCMRAPDVGNETIASSLSQLHGAKVVSSLDLTSSFWQIGVDEYLSSLLAFYGPGRKLYRNLRAPMGFINSSTALQATISRMRDIPVYFSELSHLFPNHQYNLLPKLTKEQAAQALQPIQTQIVGKISSPTKPSTTSRNPVYHTQLSFKQLLQTRPIAFRSDTIFKAYADDLNFFSKDTFSCCSTNTNTSPATSSPAFVTPHSQPIPDSLFYHHLAELELLFLKMQKGNLKLSPDKTHICKTSISILGFQWSLNKLSIEDNRLKGFKDFKTPTSKSECRSLIGAYSFFRAFIPGFARLAKPINDLAHSKQTFKWESIHDKAKDDLYQAISQNSSLHLFDPSKPVHLHTDASTAAAGGFISQPCPNGSLVLFNYSRLFTPAERNASPFRREILSCLYGLKSYQFILQAAKEVVLHIDAKAMCWLKWAKSADPYVYRLSADLSEFNIDKIVCVPTILHTGADYLSRMNKDSDKIEALLGKQEKMTLYEAECLAHRLHFERMQEITGNDLHNLLHGNSPPSFLLKKTGKKIHQRNLPTSTKPPIMPKVNKPRAIRAPILSDRSIINKDGPFMLPKYRKAQRSRLVKSLRQTEQTLKNMQKELYHLDQNTSANNLSATEVYAHALRKHIKHSGPLRRSPRLNKKTQEVPVIPNDQSNFATLPKDSPLLNTNSEKETQLDSPLTTTKDYYLDLSSVKSPTHAQSISNTYRDKCVTSSFTTHDLFLQAKILHDGQITLKHFKEQQINDPLCSKILNNITNHKQYFVKNDLLCKKHPSDPTNFLVVLPKSLLAPLIQLHHFSSHSGHQNPRSLERILSQKYFYPKMLPTITEITASCGLCQLYATKKLDDTKIGIETVLGPRQKWIADLFHISLPFSDETSYNFVLCCVDSYTRYCVLFPLKNKSEAELYNAFLLLFATHGIPQAIKTDGESGIAAQNLTDQLASLNIIHERGSPGHSRGQSAAEQTIGRVKEIVHKLHRHNSSLSIPEILALASTQINTYVNTLGTTAERLLYHYQSPNKNDLLIHQDNVHNHPELIELLTKHVDSIINKRKARRDDRRKFKNLTKRISPIFQPGDIVFVYDKHLIKSHTGLRCTFSGPYIVMANDKNQGYVLKHLRTNNLIKRSNEVIVPATQPIVHGLLSHNWDQHLTHST